MKVLSSIFTITIAALTIISCDSKQMASAGNSASESVATTANQLDISNSTVGASIPQTTIKPDKMKHDFGVISEGDLVNTTFTITNTGKNPMIINEAKGSCGCTVPKVDKNIPIAPGETTEIGVQFNSSGRPNTQNKTVTLIGNFPQTVLQITSNVTPKAGGAVAAPTSPSLSAPTINNVPQRTSTQPGHEGHNHE